MMLMKPAPVTVIAHEVATVTASQSLPGVDDAHSVGARSVILQNLDNAEPLWFTLDGSAAGVDSAILLPPRGLWYFTLEDVRLIKVAAADPNSVKVGATFYR